MSIEERAAVAAELKATGKCNCTQSVVKVFEDKLPIDDETLMKLTAGYAAGMGCMESTCGALIGAVMVAGILTDGKGTPRISKQQEKRSCSKSLFFLFPILFLWQGPESLVPAPSLSESGLWDNTEFRQPVL